MIYALLVGIDFGGMLLLMAPLAALVYWISRRYFDKRNKETSLKFSIITTFIATPIIFALLVIGLMMIFMSAEKAG